MEDVSPHLARTLPSECSGMTKHLAVLALAARDLSALSEAARAMQRRVERGYRHG